MGASRFGAGERALVRARSNAKPRKPRATPPAPMSHEGGAPVDSIFVCGTDGGGGEARGAESEEVSFAYRTSTAGLAEAAWGPSSTRAYVSPSSPSHCLFGAGETRNSEAPAGR